MTAPRCLHADAERVRVPGSGPAMACLGCGFVASRGRPIPRADWPAVVALARDVRARRGGR